MRRLRIYRSGLKLRRIDRVRAERIAQGAGRDAVSPPSAPGSRRDGPRRGLGRPPHGSEQAGLPHSALCLGYGRRSVPMGEDEGDAVLGSIVWQGRGDRRTMAGPSEASQRESWRFQKQRGFYDRTAAESQVHRRNNTPSAHQGAGACPSYRPRSVIVSTGAHRLKPLAPFSRECWG